MPTRTLDTRIRRPASVALILILVAALSVSTLAQSNIVSIGSTGTMTLRLPIIQNQTSNQTTDPTTTDDGMTDPTTTDDQMSDTTGMNDPTNGLPEDNPPSDSTGGGNQVGQEQDAALATGHAITQAIAGEPTSETSVFTRGVERTTEPVTAINDGSGGADGTPVCDDLLILIDDKPLGETVTLGKEFTLTLGLGPNVMLKRVDIKSDNLVLKRAITRALMDIPVLRTPACVNYTQRFVIPSAAGGSYPLAIKLAYSDATLTRRVFAIDTTIIVPGGKGWLSDDMMIMLANMRSGPPPRLQREFLPDDYELNDLEALGITLADYQKGIALLRQGDKEGAKRLLGDIKQLRSLDRTMTATDEDKVGPALRQRFKDAIKASLGVEPVVESRVFAIEHDGNTLTKSRVVISVPANFMMHTGEVVVYIPKEIAASVDEISFSEEPDEIIETDPVVKWAFSNVPQDQYREYGMTVDGDSQNFEVVAKAAADKPSLLARFIIWLAGLFS